MRLVRTVLFAIVGAAVSVVAFGYLRQPLRRLMASRQLHTRLVFEPLGPGDLQRTVQVLARRIENASGQPAFAKVENGTLFVDVVSMPTISTERLTQRALLEFRAVDDDDATLQSLQLPPGTTLHWDYYEGKEHRTRRASYVAGPDRQALLELLRTHPVSGREWLTGPQGEGWRSYLVGPPRLTNDNVTEVAKLIDEETRHPYVWVRFDDAGKRELGRLTKEITGGRLAISLDGTVLTAPVVQQQLSTGIAAITLGGMLPMKEELRQARDLELTLQAGALPAPVRFAGTKPLPQR